MPLGNIRSNIITGKIRGDYITMSNSLWTWSGTYFGVHEGNSLFTRYGIEAGRFYNEDIYGANGAYLGELKDGKLITNQSKKSWRKSSFIPRRRVGHVGYVGHVGTVMIAGYEDFPAPETFQ